MPATVLSSAPSSSKGSSSQSRKATTMRYRMVNHGSQVDESLFGVPNRVKQADDMKKGGQTLGGPGDLDIERQAQTRSAGRKKASAKRPKEVYTVVTKDLIRNLIVPEEHNDETCVLSGRHFARLIQASRTLSKEERAALAAQREREKREQHEASTKRRTEMQVFDLSRQKGEQLSDLELEARQQSDALLSRANELRQEQEDDIKFLNELILDAKCHAIRDAQILEKHMVSKEQELEERRLDEMMELDRRNALLIQDEIEKKRAEESKLGAVMLLRQMEENEQQRLYEEESRDQENFAMLRYLERLQLEDLESMQKKKGQQRGLAKEYQRANAEVEHLKKRKREQEVAEDLKVLIYQKEKAEREAALEVEAEQRRLDKEKEVARLRALQERAKDIKSEQDALRAKRDQEQWERDWRKREKEEMRKLTIKQDEMRQAREDQILSKQRMLAIEAQREKADFERVLKTQKEIIKKEVDSEFAVKDKRYKHSDELRKQIHQKEEVRIQDRNNFFEEGVKLDLEARQRRAKLDDVKRKKLDELKSMGVPEKYCAHIERKMGAPPTVPS